MSGASTAAPAQRPWLRALSLDPRLPVDMIVGAGTAVAELPDSWVVDTARAEHVQLAADSELAAEAVAWMLGEAPASAPEE